MLEIRKTAAHGHPRPTRLSLCLSLSLAALAAQAQTDASKEPTLPAVTVSGTRTENKIDEVPATVSVIAGEDIEKRLVRDLRDLVRYEPNVSVNNNPTRFGNTGINIRGIEGNRILMQVDGIRLPDTFSIGSFSFATRDSIDPDLLKSVEVLRGPGSSLYGSDALGGVVSFYTKDPADLLRESGKPYYLGLKQAWADADGSRLSSATLAGGKGSPVQGLLYVNRREGRDTDNFGGNAARGGARTAPNPQDNSSTAVLAKLVWDAGGRLPLMRFTVESRDADTATDVATLNSLSPKTTMLTGDDRSWRTRYTADAEWGKIGMIDALRVAVYQQDSKTRQRTLERRDATSAGCSGTTTGTNICVRDVEFAFDQEIKGASAQGETRLGGARWTQRISYGIDVSRTRTQQSRDGVQIITNAAGATTTSKTVGADVFPVRDFPISRTTQTGLYVQDEILLADGALSLVPGVRYDRFRLTPRIDDVFAADNPGIAVKEIDDKAVSPRIGVVWKILPQLALYGQYAKGFRAPPYNDVNLGFTNLAFGYTAIPNPDLKAEKSQGYELGLRGSGASYSWSLVYFDNRYRDFIASLVQLNCPGDPRCSTTVPITFQSINMDRVKITGIELRGDLSLDAAVRGLKLIASYGATRGENQLTGAPIDSIDPRKTVAGLRYDAPSRVFGIEAFATNYAKKDRIATATQFASPSATVVDLTAYWRYNAHLELTAGAFNLGDRKYWMWSDVRGIAATSTVLDRYTQPGRNFAAAVKIVF